ncbi:MAG: TrmH family RNA methyltransferase [Candidatus Cloacimonetes bacterium]|nr:TrmH family RNA methyltransferase [Candidatus Cloacimonadota bacterium]
MISKLHIVLFEPEIPQNTGNIGRLCVGSDSPLHLIRPFRFMLDDKTLKRAGLDYWQDLDLHIHESVEEIFSSFPHDRIFLATTKTKTCFWDKSIKRAMYSSLGRNPAVYQKAFYSNTRSSVSTFL